MDVGFVNTGNRVIYSEKYRDCLDQSYSEKSQKMDPEQFHYVPFDAWDIWKVASHLQMLMS